MKNWWDILGVEQDADLRSIKRAYAAKLKTIRQDEDPQGFMKVREAYDIAVQNKQNSETENVYLNDFDESDIYESKSGIQKADWYDARDIHIAEFPYVDIKAPEEPELAEKINKEVEVVAHLMNCVKVLVTKPTAHNDKQAWADIFDDPRLVTINDFLAFEASFIEYLMQSTKYEDNYHRSEYNDCLRNYETPILRPPISKFIFGRMGWDNLDYQRAYATEIAWLGYQFGAFINPQQDTYWYDDKKVLDRTLIRIRVDETELHPGYMFLITIVGIIIFGVVVGTWMRLI